MELEGRGTTMIPRSWRLGIKMPRLPPFFVAATLVQYILATGLGKRMAKVGVILPLSVCATVLVANRLALGYEAQLRPRSDLKQPAQLESLR